VLFLQKHIKKSRQLSLLLRPTGGGGTILGELRESVCQDAHGYGVRKVDSVPRRRQLPTCIVSASQRPSLSFRTPVHLRLTARERTQFTDLNLYPVLVPSGVHLLHFEMVEHNQRFGRLEKVTLTEPPPESLHACRKAAAT